MWLDKYSIRNLELFPRRENPQKGASLLEVLDKTQSPMGARLLRRWLVMPLRDKAAIEKRQDVVAAFIEHTKPAEKIQKLLAQAGDMERMVSRASAGKINPRETAQLGYGLERAGEIKKHVLQIPQLEVVMPQVTALDGCSELVATIRTTLAQDPPAQPGKGKIVADGFDAQLDELRYIVSHNKEYLQEMQHKAVQETGITSLKIGFNNVFGYYIEVRNTHKDKVPPSWIRKQTLVSAERYITEELKLYEEKILGAEERIAQLELDIFNRLVHTIHGWVRPIQENARILAELDCLLSFATLAQKTSTYVPSCRIQTYWISGRAGIRFWKPSCPPVKNTCPTTYTWTTVHNKSLSLRGPIWPGNLPCSARQASLCLWRRLAPMFRQRRPPSAL